MVQGRHSTRLTNDDIRISGSSLLPRKKKYQSFTGCSTVVLLDCFRPFRYTKGFANKCLKSVKIRPVLAVVRMSPHFDGGNNNIIVINHRNWIFSSTDRRIQPFHVMFEFILDIEVRMRSTSFKKTRRKIAVKLVERY